MVTILTIKTIMIIIIIVIVLITTIITLMIVIIIITTIITIIGITTAASWVGFASARMCSLGFGFKVGGSSATEGSFVVGGPSQNSGFRVYRV